MSKVSRENQVLGNFHQSTGTGHPKESTGNQQVWGPGGDKAGSIEYKPSPNGFDLQLNDTNGKKITDL